MSEGTLTEARIRSLLCDLNSCSQQCGFEAFVVTKNSPKLKRMSLAERKNTDGKIFRDILKEMFFTVITVKHNLPGSQKSADFPLETFSSFLKNYELS